MFSFRKSLLLWLCVLNVVADASAQVQTNAQPSFDEVLVRAQNGETQMQVVVGTMYEERGSVTNALRWYKEAAMQGHPGGQFKLGLMHAQGIGVPQDMTAAVTWLEKSAKQGFVGAQYNLGVCWENGLGTGGKNYEQALKWYKLAAEQNEPSSQKAVGVFYEKGLGVKQDLIEAYKWYSLSSSGGSVAGDVLRKSLAPKLKPEELVVAQKRFTDYVAARAANSTTPPPRLPVETNAVPKAKPKTKDFLD